MAGRYPGFVFTYPGAELVTQIALLHIVWPVIVLMHILLCEENNIIFNNNPCFSTKMCIIFQLNFQKRGDSQVMGHFYMYVQGN